MTDQHGNLPHFRGSAGVQFAALGMIVVIFGGIIGFSSLQLRKDLRGKVVQRYADIWGPVSKFQVEQGVSDDLSGILDFDDAIIFSLMSAQEVDGALGIQVFDMAGQYLAGVPAEIEEFELSLDSVERMQTASPWAVYLPEGSYVESGSSPQPEIELNIPILGRDGLRIEYLARYLMDGYDVRDELRIIDANLTKQASLAFFSGILLVSVVFIWSFWGLRNANKEVAERAARLAKANAELAMVAKTSAIGAVASHLIHGLNNPLAGIREHFRSNGEDLEQDDWADARKATSRMQAMINEVVDVLKNEYFDEMETLSGEGIAQYLRNKFELKAKEKELDFGVRSEARILLSARDANIAKLILSNLLDNAIEAVSERGEVETRIVSLNEEVVFTIIDTGPGFSEIAKSNLFSPIQSSKTAGAGIGLAISQQLARHLGATLELTRSSSSGSEIQLTLSSAQKVANQS